MSKVQDRHAMWNYELEGTPTDQSRDTNVNQQREGTVEEERVKSFVHRNLIRPMREEWQENILTAPSVAIPNNSIKPVHMPLFAVMIPLTFFGAHKTPNTRH